MEEDNKSGKGGEVTITPPTILITLGTNSLREQVYLKKKNGLKGK